MNEAVASSFPAALRACMEAGCGKKLNADGFAMPWTQRMLAEEVEVSDRAVRQWLGGERTPDSKNFEQLLFILSPKDCPRQRAVYEQLEANRPPPQITRRPSRPSPAAEPQHLQPIPPDARPYRGLEAFREEDAHLFFGRDALAQNVLDKLDHHRLVLLIGASGSGKSSLINAGILPKLRQDPDRTIVRCTPGDRAIANLAAALAHAIEPDRSPADLLPAQHTYRQQLEADPDAIRDIAQLLPGKRLFLVIDQFEESFTLTRPTNPKQHEALIATLLAIARSPDERRLNALLGMRSDFQNELETADPELIQRLHNAMVQMRSMLPAEREAAITEPVKAYGVSLEPGLLTDITADLADNRDALPLLEVALDDLWSRRDDTRRCLTLAASAYHWLEDTADDKARELWGRLELSFGQWDGLPDHDRAALAGISTVGREVRQRFLAIATTDADAARKLNRKPALVLRAALGLDPDEAADLGALALAAGHGDRAFEANLAWLILARKVVPIVPTHSPTIVGRALNLAAETTDGYNLQALLETIAAVADSLDPDHAKQIVGRAIDLAETTNVSSRLYVLSKAIAVLSHQLDAAAAKRTVVRVLDLFEKRADLDPLKPLVQCVAALAVQLDAITAKLIVCRAVEIFGKSTDTLRLRPLAQIIAALSGHHDLKMVHAAAERAVAHAFALADEANALIRVQVLVHAISDLASLLDERAADNAVNRVLDLLSRS